jgi:hypothetical protein
MKNYPVHKNVLGLASAVQIGCFGQDLIGNGVDRLEIKSARRVG